MVSVSASVESLSKFNWWGRRAAVVEVDNDVGQRMVQKQMPDRIVHSVGNDMLSTEKPCPLGGT